MLKVIPYTISMAEGRYSQKTDAFVKWLAVDKRWEISFRRIEILYF